MRWTYHLLTSACLIGAVVAYSAVPVLGAMMLCAGIILEGTFWMRLLRRRH